MHVSTHRVALRRAPLRAVLALCAAFATAGLAGTALAGEPEAAKPEQHISFVIDHADSAKGLVDGTFAGFELTSAVVDLKNLDKTFAEYEIDLSTVNTGNAKRDAHLATADFFDVAKFPKAKLRIDGVAKGKGEKDYTATATLSLHGVEKKLPVAFTVLEQRDDGSVVVEGGTKMTRSEFAVGLAPDKSGAADALEVKVRLVVATKQASASK